jgi:hypothetical protein
MLPVWRFTRKSVRQTFLIGLALMVAAAVWLVVSIAVTPSLSPDTHALIGLLPAALLALGGCGFLGTWGSFQFQRLFGRMGYEDE